MSYQQLRSLDNVDLQAVGAKSEGLGFDNASLFGMGFGYQINNWLRFDATGEYRGKANFHGNQHFVSGNLTEANSYSASHSSVLLLANVYVDLGTWWNITPFVGAGAGAAYNMINSFRDEGLMVHPGPVYDHSVTYAAERGAWNLAWAVHAGLAYAVTPGVTLEFAYRYIDLGSATTGMITGFDSSSPPNQNTWTMKNITSHDFKLGVRWRLGEPDSAPAMVPPLVRKG